MGPVFVTSWDDGSKFDLRLANLLEKYNLPGIFYIPSNCELSKTEILDLHTRGFEIGGHTETHPSDMKRLCTTDQRREILSNRVWLESIVKTDILKFCYPTGKYNEDTVMVLGQCGIAEARTTVQDNIDIPTDLYRIKTSVHVYPKSERFNKPDWFDKAVDLYIQSKHKENGYFHLWGHSWEISKWNMWNELEEFFKFVTK